MMNPVLNALQPYLAELGEERFRLRVWKDTKDFVREELNAETLMALGLGMGMHVLGQSSFRLIQARTSSAILAHAARIVVPTLASALFEVASSATQATPSRSQIAVNALGFELSSLASHSLEIYLSRVGFHRFSKILITRALSPLLFPVAEVALKGVLHFVGLERRASPSNDFQAHQFQASDYLRYLRRDLLFLGLHRGVLKLKQTVVKPPSVTAQLVAYARGEAHEQRLYGCSDPWAKRFCDWENLPTAIAIVKERPKYTAYMAIRTRWLDRLVEQFSARHPQSQIVILGAGFDSRAARLRAEGRTFFEVDHPASSRNKRRQVAALPDYPGNPTYVECDFSRDCFIEKLRGRGFNSQTPTLFIMEGVSMYLSDDALRANIRKIKQIPQAVYAFDFFSRKALELIQGTLFDSRARKNNERMVWGSNDPTHLFENEGVSSRRVTFEAAAQSLAPHERPPRWMELYGFMVGGE